MVVVEWGCPPDHLIVCRVRVTEGERVDVSELMSAG